MIQNGNHEACAQLIERNTMFIRSAAIQFEKRYGGAVLNCDDYEQEGRIALLHAAERFVPEKGKLSVEIPLYCRRVVGKPFLLY